MSQKWATKYVDKIATIVLTWTLHLLQRTAMSNAASRVIDICGGPKAVAGMLGIGVISVRKWTYTTDRNGGTGGRVPTKRIAPLIRAARAHGIALTPADFFDDEDCHAV